MDPHHFNYNAAHAYLNHPTRLLVVGQSQVGKTTRVVDLIKSYFSRQVNRIIIVCPNWDRQKTFDPIRHLVNRNEDVYTQIHQKTFQAIQQSILNNIARAEKTKQETPKVLVLVDDCAGTSAVQGKGMGAFANLSVQTTHWNVSMFVITQQPKRVDLNFRDNAENLIIFQDRGMAGYSWLKEAYTALDMNTESVKEMLLLAWRGGRTDDKERGRHFLFIRNEPFAASKFFIDFAEEITIHKK